MMYINDVLAHRREHEKKIKNKDTPFRVEFRFSGGTVHWVYFENLNDCYDAWDAVCKYSPFGKEIIEMPTSKQIQMKGPRGGWKKYNPEGGK